MIGADVGQDYEDVRALLRGEILVEAWMRGVDISDDLLERMASDGAAALVERGEDLDEDHLAGYAMAMIDARMGVEIPL